MEPVAFPALRVRSAFRSRRVFGAPDGGAIALRAALSEVDLGDDPERSNAVRHRAIGYDIDALCSVADGASCPAPAWLTELERERPSGIDNSAGALFERLSDGLAALGSSETSARIRAGRGTMFLRIDGYSGALDDAVVAVSLARTLPHAQPAWRGTDLWVLAAEDHGAAAEQPKQFDTRGYVAGGVMVARFPTLVFRLPNPDGVPLDILLSRVVVTCRLEPNQVIQPFQARACVLSGAWHHKDALSRARGVSGSGSVSGCAAALPERAGHTRSFASSCASASMLTSVGGSANPCDAISFALRFETTPAFFDSQTLGALPEAPARCSTPEDDPALDGC